MSGAASGAATPVVGDRTLEPLSSPVSPEILQAIREQMAVSLQRMRELEEQVAYSQTIIGHMLRDNLAVDIQCLDSEKLRWMQLDRKKCDIDCL